MKLTATFNVPDGTTPRDLRLLLADALAEFRSARGPSPEAYVDRRYPLPEYASVYPEGPARERKIAEVTARRECVAYIRDEGFSVAEPSEVSA